MDESTYMHELDEQQTEIPDLINLNHITGLSNDTGFGFKCSLV